MQKEDNFYPLVSVVIPVFNRSELLAQALQSVKNQSYKNIEIIVVDDGSDYESKKTNRFLCQKFGAIFLEEEHCGLPSKLRNIGAKNASGSLLAFLDSDDLWNCDKIANQIDYIKMYTEESVLILHTKEEWNRSGKIISQKNQHHSRSGDIFSDALHKCIIGPSTVLLNRELFLLVGGFNEKIEVAEDYELWLRFCLLFQVHYIDEPLIVKRAGEWEQLSLKYGQIEIFRMEALLIFIEEIRLNFIPNFSSLKIDLDKISKNNFLSLERLQNCLELAIQTLKSKIEIYLIGCKKRNRRDEIERWRKISNAL